MNISQQRCSQQFFHSIARYKSDTKAHQLRLWPPAAATGHHGLAATTMDPVPCCYSALRSAGSSISNNMVGDALWYQPQLFALVTLEYKCDVVVPIYCANKTHCDMQNDHESVKKKLSY